MRVGRLCTIAGGLYFYKDFSYFSLRNRWVYFFLPPLFLSEHRQCNLEDCTTSPIDLSLSLRRSIYNTLKRDIKKSINLIIMSMIFWRLPLIHLKKCIHMLSCRQIRCLMLIFDDAHDENKREFWSGYEFFQVLSKYSFFTTFVLLFAVVVRKFEVKTKHVLQRF